MKIATWNVNSIKARIPRVIEWLKNFQPDIALFQELKSTDETFPFADFEKIGYHIVVSGQKSYNGVGILSKTPIKVQLSYLPGSETDKQARYIEATTNNIRVASIYLPNGNPSRTEDGRDSEKFTYKISWMERLFSHTQSLLQSGHPFVLGGDYNVCPSDRDLFDPEKYIDDALCRLETRSQFRAIMNLGLTDAFRTFTSAPNHYSYWDYQRGAWAKDNGLLIDHLLLSPQAADRLIAAGIDRKPRDKEKPSDHTPVWCELTPN